MGWSWLPQHATPPAPTVIEQVKEQKPVLYDAKGKPLIYERKPIGFRPPKDEQK